MSIKLVKDTIDFNDVLELIEWLKTNPRLTKGDLTVEFEKEWLPKFKEKKQNNSV